MTIENNIFKYATSELSQDAVICWILSFYNDKNSKLYNLAKDLLSSFVTLSPEDNKIEIQQQFYKTDILIHLPNTKRVIIIEDKIYSTEHDEQIFEYVKKISKNENYKNCKIYAVYFKTGFYYDNDKLVEDKYNKLVGKYLNNENVKIDSFKSIHGKDFLNILQNYAHIDATLDMYIEHLDYLIKWYDIYGKFYNKNDEKPEKFNLSIKYIAQYKLMREIFPEEKWNKDDKNELYMVYSGSSRGRPWTEIKILNGTDYKVFWRIDTDNKGPYLSLRYYNPYDKDNDKERRKHTNEYQIYYKCAKEACGENEYCKLGKKENYFEATLLHIHISDVLANWSKEKKSFINIIRSITDKFITCVNNQK